MQITPATLKRASLSQDLSNLIIFWYLTLGQPPSSLAVPQPEWHPSSHHQAHPVVIVPLPCPFRPKTLSRLKRPKPSREDAHRLCIYQVGWVGMVYLYVNGWVVYIISTPYCILATIRMHFTGKEMARRFWASLLVTRDGVTHYDWISDWNVPTIHTKMLEFRM